MNTGIKILLVLLMFTACAGKGDRRLNGEWKLIEFKISDRYGNSKTSDVKTLRNLGAVWNLNFNGNGSFRQDFNMNNAAMSMETQEGNWITSGDTLKVELIIDSLVSRMNYHYQIKNDTLQLHLEHPLTKNKVDSKFVRK